MPKDLLGPLITSKTRLKLLLRFFVNQELGGYLQGLSKELEENTNSVRVELNRLEGAGIIQSNTEGRRKIFRVNPSHPLVPDLTSIIRKVTGIDAVVERVVDRAGKDLRQVWICGKLAQGIDSNEIEVLLIGEAFDMDYLAQLMPKVEQHINKSISYFVAPQASETQKESCLLVWEKQGRKI